jgi:hypothetical protein
LKDAYWGLWGNVECVIDNQRLLIDRRLSGTFARLFGIVVEKEVGR